MFGAILRELVEGVDGGVASVVMGLDGIALGSYAVDAAAVDPDAVGIELGVVLKALKHAVAMLEGGQTQEFCVTAKGLMTVVRVLDDEFFIALALRPDASVGRARYLLRVNASHMKACIQA
jgi:predicted regulator of Ras-like GTPase activity (Roadblock/LC7/MglB family)